MALPTVASLLVLVRHRAKADVPISDIHARLWPILSKKDFQGQERISRSQTDYSYGPMQNSVPGHGLPPERKLNPRA